MWRRVSRRRASWAATATTSSRRSPTAWRCPSAAWLGSFSGSTYDEVTFELSAGDVYVFCSDGVFEANDALGREFGAERLLAVVTATRKKGAREIVDAIFAAVQEFRADTPPNDDM